MCSRCTPSSRAARIFQRSSGWCAAGKSAACGSRISRVMPRSSMSHGSPAAASWRERWRDAPALWRCSRSGRSEGQAPWRRAATISTPSERLYRQMDAALAPRLSPGDQDREIASTVRRERGRLLAFIRASIADAAEAEDVLQEALYELVLAYRLMQPVEQAGAWLRRVARNRIIDRFRRKRVERRAAGAAESEAAAPRAAEDEGSLEPVLEDLLPAPDSGPESAVMREVLLAEIEAALAELPPEQREVFIAHEIEGVSFKELAARTGVGLNTLLSRKRYAVLYLQERLRAVWDEWLLGSIEMGGLSTTNR